MNNPVQDVLRGIEVGKGQFLVRIIPLTVFILLVTVVFNFWIYHGLSDQQSFDNAQLARQIARGDGFTTRFIRPYALAQLREHAQDVQSQSGQAVSLFPADQFPAGKARVIPDTYNAPGYPYLLAAWFSIVRPDFDQSTDDIGKVHMYQPDRWIPFLNLIFLILTAGLVFWLALRLFDERVAWMAAVTFLITDLFWRFSISGMSTSFLMFLVTAIVICLVEIFTIGEACFEDENRKFGLGWIWVVVLSLLLAVACLTRLQLLVLLVPIGIVLGLMPRAQYFTIPVVVILVVGAVTPWFLHVNSVSGNWFGSNTPLLIYGEENYDNNEIYCKTEIPNYERLFKDVSKKEFQGLRWHMEHAWRLLGVSPMVLLFAASLLHRFKRRRVQMLQWMLVGSAVALILINSLAVPNPEATSAWNIIVILSPVMIIIGSAFFFILLDRLDLHLWLLNHIIIICMLIITGVPLTLSLTTTGNQMYAFPPYVPPVIRWLGQLSNTDEWVTTDMPWAMAWYADRGSLWVPDTISEFVNINDTVCPSGLLMFTPVTWAQPVSNLTTGEDKEWQPFFTLVNVPSTFPLRVHTYTPRGGPEYSLWSDRPRWQGK